MIVEKSMHPGWLSNTYLVADQPGGHAVLIDTGGPPEPILARIDELELTVTHALCTHDHVDHVANNGLFKSRTGCSVCAHEAEGADVDLTLGDGQEIRSGGLTVRALHVPGHTRGQLAFWVDEERVFTGDTLFKGSVGGTRGGGPSGFSDIKRSIMEVLMKLPLETVVHPGHSESTTVGEEWERNGFIRLWRGLDAPGTGRCTALGRPATLILRAPDYDGGTKCWVRYQGGQDAIIGGSAVRDAG